MTTLLKKKTAPDGKVKITIKVPENLVIELDEYRTERRSTWINSAIMEKVYAIKHGKLKDEDNSENLKRSAPGDKVKMTINVPESLIVELDKYRTESAHNRSMWVNKAIMEKINGIKHDKIKKENNSKKN